MRIPTRSLAISAILAASVLAARADSYTFTISTGPTSTTPGTTFVVSGVLTGTPDSKVPSAIDLTGVTGSGQGYTFTGVVPLGSDSSLTYDNVLYTDPAANHVDSEGALLYLSSPIGTSLAHVYDNGGYHVDVFDPKDRGDITPFTIDSFTLTSSSVPEPSTWLLLGTGILVLAVAAKRTLLHS